MRKVLALPFALAAMLAFAVSASASLVFNQTFPAVDAFGPTIPNPCNGEVVTISGNVHLVMTATPTGNGGFHVLVDGNADGVKGTGSLGNNYQIPAWFVFEFNVSGTGASTQTEGDIFNVISLNGAPNFVHEDTLTLVVNPTTGILSITASNGHDKCVG